MNRLSLTTPSKAPREALINRMAADLIRLNATADERTAIAALMGHYSYGEIAAFAGDAAEEARRILLMARVPYSDEPSCRGRR